MSWLSIKSTKPVELHSYIGIIRLNGTLTRAPGLFIKVKRRRDIPSRAPCRWPSTLADIGLAEGRSKYTLPKCRPVRRNKRPQEKELRPRDSMMTSMDVRFNHFRVRIEIDFHLLVFELASDVRSSKQEGCRRPRLVGRVGDVGGTVQPTGRRSNLNRA